MDDLRETLAETIFGSHAAFDPEDCWMDDNLTEWEPGQKVAKVDGDVNFTAIADAALAAIKQAGFVVVPAESMGVILEARPKT